MKEVYLPGRHCLIDMYGISAANLSDRNILHSLLCEAVDYTGLHAIRPAEIVEYPGGGLTGIVILSESHIAFHTYPELGYLAIDLFTCGDADPERAVEILQARMAPARIEVQTIRRGALLLAPH